VQMSVAVTKRGTRGLCEFQRAHVLDHQATHKGVVVEAHPAARQVPGHAKGLMGVEPFAAEIRPCVAQVVACRCVVGGHEGSIDRADAGPYDQVYADAKLFDSLNEPDLSGAKEATAAPTPNPIPSQARPFAPKLVQRQPLTRCNPARWLERRRPSEAIDGNARSSSGRRFKQTQLDPTVRATELPVGVN
jgi:hypothetical protein